MNRADIAAIAHAVTFLLCMCGIVAKTDAQSAQSVIAAAIAAVCGLAAQCVIAWKYLHHDAQQAERRFSLTLSDHALEREKRFYENQMERIERQKKSQAKEQQCGQSQSSISPPLSTQPSSPPPSRPASGRSMSISDQPGAD